MDLLPRVKTVTYYGLPGDLFHFLDGVPGVWIGPVIAPFLPVRWSRSKWEYVAILLDADPVKQFLRQFVGQSGSVGSDRRRARSGPMVYQFDPDDLGVGALLEIRTGGKKAERYQRIFRRVDNGWNFLAYRQQDVAGWSRFDAGLSGGGYRYKRFYPWEIVQS